ncbi:hypothetical protein Tco_1321709 [Tanacetum coccineum]
MPELMRDGLFAMMVMDHRDDAGVVVFTSRAWGRLFDTRGPLVRELILDFLSMPRFGKVLLDLDAHGDEMESPDFARGLDVRSVNIPYLLARYPRRIAAGRKSGAHISSGQFVAMGPERQPDTAAGAPGVAQDAPIVDEDAQADPAPAITGLVRMMDRAGVAYVPYSETHVPYQRCQVRQRTGEASTSAAQQDPQQPDP